jgi:hypothetical protein
MIVFNLESTCSADDQRPFMFGPTIEIVKANLILQLSSFAKLINIVLFIYQRKRLVF